MSDSDDYEYEYDESDEEAMGDSGDEEQSFEYPDSESDDGGGGGDDDDDVALENACYNAKAERDAGELEDAVETFESVARTGIEQKEEAAVREGSRRADAKARGTTRPSSATGDEGSVSCDWESVRDKDAAHWGAERIVLELPSEGLLGEDKVEAGVSAAEADDGSHCSRSVAGSSISSFVPVSRFDRMSVQPKVEVMVPVGKAAGLAKIDGSDNSVAGSSISSFAHVSQMDSASKQSKGELLDSESFSYQYKSEASSQAADDESLLSNFEVLSLPSGEVVLRCKRCTFHNKPGVDVCAVCQLALVANPNIDVDAQIAAHLLQKEDPDVEADAQLAADLLRKEEEERSRILQNPFYDHACVLMRDIKLECCPQWLSYLPDEDLQRLVLGFTEQIMDFPDPKRILLALKCTSYDSLEGIRTRGFSADQPFIDARQVEVSHNLNNAIDSFEMLQMMRGEPLGAILENADDGAEDQQTPGCLCWIVAIVLGCTDDEGLLHEPDCNLNTCWPPKQTLPVACFESSCKIGRDSLPAMLHSMNSNIVDGFFAKNVLQLTKTGPPSPNPPVQFSGGAEPRDSFMADVKKPMEEKEEARARIGALKANQEVDMETQVAAHLLQKEEQSRARICQNPFYDHACILTRDINKVCCNWLHTLPDEDWQCLAVGFIEQFVSFPDPKRILLALKCTSHDSLEEIRTSGFGADRSFMDAREVEVSHNLNNAIDSFERLQRMRGEPLGAIPENRDRGAEDQHVPSYLCWIVAIVLRTTDVRNSNTNTCWPPEQTLPVAYFESSSKPGQGRLPAMLRLLNDTIWGRFLARNLNLQFTKRGPPLPDPLVQFSGGAERRAPLMADAKRPWEEEEEARARAFVANPNVDVNSPVAVHLLQNWKRKGHY